MNNFESDRINVLSMKGLSVSVEETQELYDFLRGETPKGFTFREQPKLSREAAFAVIYYLQEKMYLIPDHYEQCDECGRIYESYEEGIFIDDTDQHLCDECL